MTADEIGKKGEEAVENELLKWFPDGEYFSDVYLDTRTGHKTQIDLLMLTSYCLFVFEIKNYSGRILGNRADRYWIHIVKNRRYQFYNPVLQNESHKRAVLSYFRFCLILVFVVLRFFTANVLIPVILNLWFP